jgi:hypothetical protein
MTRRFSQAELRRVQAEAASRSGWKCQCVGASCWPDHKPEIRCNRPLSGATMKVHYRYRPASGRFEPQHLEIWCPECHDRAPL